MSRCKKFIRISENARVWVIFVSRNNIMRLGGGIGENAEKFFHSGNRPHRICKNRDVVFRFFRCFFFSESNPILRKKTTKIAGYCTEMTSIVVHVYF